MLLKEHLAARCLICVVKTNAACFHVYTPVKNTTVADLDLGLKGGGRGGGCRGLAKIKWPGPADPSPRSATALLP